MGCRSINSSDWTLTYMETHLLLSFGSLIVFVNVPLYLTLVFPALLDPAAFLGLLPPLTFLLFFFFS